MKNSIRILVDSTYILPAFKIGVEGVTVKDLLFLDRMYRTGKAIFYYTDIVWIEILPKVIKEYRKLGLRISVEKIGEVVLSLKATFRRANVGSKALEKALELKLLGHRDMIDNLLYGIAWENNLYLLTLDSSFKSFLKENGQRYEFLIHHNQLEKLILE